MSCGRDKASFQAGRRGVSLVEVLAALALIAAVAPAMGRAWTLSMTVAGQSAQEVTAATLAENKLAEIVAAPGAAADDSGQFEPPYQRYSWQCERAAWEGDGRMTQLDVTVSWQSRGRDVSTTVSTLLTGEE
jgi:type II secretion system protein I